MGGRLAVIPGVAFRDGLEDLGTATYVRTLSGSRLTSVAALTVNAAAEAVGYRCFTCPSGEDPVAALFDDNFERRLDSDRAVVLGHAGDPALEQLAGRSFRVAALRRSAAESPGAAVQIRWLSRRPPTGSPPAQGVARLASRNLLYEPLERLARVAARRADRLTPLDLAPPLESYLYTGGPVDWPHEFLPYQRDGIRALVARSQILLADDMGLGKTVQAAAAVRILLRIGAIGNALIVAPASILGQWYRALVHWAPDLRISTVHGQDRAWRWRADAHVFLVSFETLRSDFTENPESGPRRRDWGVVILDEAQKIKNREVEAARACKRLSRVRSWALTGTPLENRVDDLRSICEFLVTSDAATRELVDPERLRETHGRLQLRRRKRDVLTDLPPKTVIEVPVELGPRQRSAYERVEREGLIWLRQLGQTVTITHVLELITRLKQVCNFCPETGESAKFDDLKERMEIVFAAGNRALIFSQYTDTQFGAGALAERLKAYRPEVYTGALGQEEREAVLQRFRSSPDARPLILSLRAGGLGLNLQEASYVFHFDRWWNPAVEQQAEDRTHRMGQAQPVTVYAYLCAGTIEERIRQILAAKGALFRDWVDEVGLPAKTSLTQDEIFGLVGMQAPRTNAPGGAGQRTS